jgi:MFS family permease
MMIFALILGIITSLRIATVHSISLIVFASGIALAFNFPSWQAIVPDLVPKKDLLNAISLNSAQFNAARLIGPAIAGVILAAWGVASCFYLNSLSFLAVIFALTLIRPNPNPKTKREADESIWKYTVSGIKYAKNHLAVAVLLLSVGLISILGTPYTTLMPIYARNILKVGPKGYGFLLAAGGLGAVLGAFFVAPLSRYAKKQTLIKAGIIILSTFLLIFAFSKSFILSMMALAIVGGSLLAVLSTINTSLQTSVPNEIRGRIMSLYVLMYLGLMPFGSLIFGSLAHILTSPIAISIGAIGCLMLGFVLIINHTLIEDINE